MAQRRVLRPAYRDVTTAGRIWLGIGWIGAMLAVGLASLRAETERLVDWPALVRVNPAAAHILIGRLGSEGAPRFFQALNARQRAVVAAADLALLRVVADFGAAGIEAYLRHGHRVVTLHRRYGLRALDQLGPEP